MIWFVGIFFTVLVYCVEKNLATLRCHLYLIQSGFVPNMYIPTADTEKGGKVFMFIFLYHKSPAIAFIFTYDN
jgi:hypothetical protein